MMVECFFDLFGFECVVKFEIVIVDVVGWIGNVVCEWVL